MVKRAEALLMIYDTWSDQLSLLLNINPKFENLVTSVMTLEPKYILSSTGFFILFETRIKWVLVALNVTLHCSAHRDSVCKSLLMFCMDIVGLSTTSTSVVSSA